MPGRNPALQTGIAMIATEDKQSDYPSDLADLRRVPLADVPALIDGVLGRLVPDSTADQVPVAAFNSAI